MGKWGWVFHCCQITFQSDVHLLILWPNLFAGVELQFPSNTYYPPGLVCAKENTKWFCPTSGESGSPLMKKNDGGRFEAEGILSFIKGCGVFAFYDNIFDLAPRHHSRRTNSLYQVSNNPSVYTKISCFLPWIAKQYDLEYKESSDMNPACSTGRIWSQFSNLWLSMINNLFIKEYIGSTWSKSWSALH